jgi:hypothetical protein
LYAVFVGATTESTEEISQIGPQNRARRGVSEVGVLVSVFISLTTQLLLRRRSAAQDRQQCTRHLHEHDDIPTYKSRDEQQQIWWTVGVTPQVFN